MPYEAYPRPKDDNGMGLHTGGNGWFPLGEGDIAGNVQHYVDMKFKWAKVLTCGPGSGLESVKALRAAGIETIVRCYRPTPHASTLDADPALKAGLPAFVAAGNRYFEVQNEPNVNWEWPNNTIPPDAHEQVAHNFMVDADYILAIGGIPLITAMSPGGEQGWDDIEFLQHMLWILKDEWGLDKLRRCALACHNAVLNHDLNYPFDKVNQEGEQLTPETYAGHEWQGTMAEVNALRLRTMNKGQRLLDPGASNGWNKYAAVHDLCLRETGLDLPVLSTEGGVWVGDWQDPRYHRISTQDVTDIYNTIREMMRQGKWPDYYFCTNFWLAGSRGWGNPTMEFEHQTWFNVNGIWLQSVHDYKAAAPFIRPPYVNPAPPPVNTVLNTAQIVDVLKQAGFTGDGLKKGACIVKAESGGKTTAVGDTNLPDYPGHGSYGMWQFFSFSHPEISRECAFDPLCSSKEAFRVSQGGTVWTEWSTYNNGDYLAHWAEVCAVVDAPPVLPSDAYLHKLAYEGCLGVPDDSALMREARRLGFASPSKEVTETENCVITTMQVFSNGSQLAAFFCLMKDWSRVYRKDL